MGQRKRKIDDNILLEMLQQGKKQKDIAAHLGVSPAAICKRLKRLLPAPETVLDKYDLTDKERAFVVEKAQGRTNTQAALSSYEAGSIQAAKVIGSQLMRKPEIKSAIEELMDSHGLTKSYRIGRLKNHVDNRDPNVSLKALDQSWKLDGSYAPVKIDSSMDVRALVMGVQVSEKMMAQLNQLRIEIINRSKGVEGVDGENTEQGGN